LRRKPTAAKLAAAALCPERLFGVGACRQSGERKGGCMRLRMISAGLLSCLLLTGCGMAQLSAEQTASCEAIMSEQAADRAEVEKAPAAPTYLKAVLELMMKTLQDTLKSGNTEGFSAKMQATYAEAVEVCARSEKRPACEKASVEAKAHFDRRRERQQRFKAGNCPGKLEPGATN
jgi:hypothetical protein